jgi:hypothetical protein
MNPMSMMNPAKLNQNEKLKWELKKEGILVI